MQPVAILIMPTKRQLSLLFRALAERPRLDSKLIPCLCCYGVMLQYYLIDDCGIVYDLCLCPVAEAQGAEVKQSI